MTATGGLMRRLFPLALLLGLGAAAPADAADRGDARPLPFVADDYAGALGDARARALPLFIEAWAPW
jgi:hypothetical protein